MGWKSRLTGPGEANERCRELIRGCRGKQKTGICGFEKGATSAVMGALLNACA